MFPSISSAGKVSSPITIQTRNFSKRMIAYPRYKVEVQRKGKRDHTGTLRLMMQKFLGPCNRKGEYYSNRYFYPPTDHKPNYIAPDLEQGEATANHEGIFAERRTTFPGREFQPFPENNNCKTAFAISNDLKDKIVHEIVNGATTQATAVKYGIKIPRIEAVIKLRAIEEQWKKENKITPDMQKMSDMMYKMFPLYQPPMNAENLTEIPIPSKTQRSRFLTIAESEPFGPIDAANVFGLEPAADILKKLAEYGAEALSAKKIKIEKGFIAPVLKGERASYTFTNAKVGVVGHRYGAGNRDNKKDRRISFDAAGKMIYA